MPVAGNRLIVVGASVGGAYAAIAGSNAGFAVTLVEKYPALASRRTVFNLAPSVADSLRKLDDGGNELVDALQVIVRRYSDDTVNGQTNVENTGRSIIADHTRRLTAAALEDGFTGVDSRPWSRVEIAGIENHMREYIARRHPDIETRYGTTLEGITQTRDSVTAHLVDGVTGAKDSIDGAWLVSATGGRNVLGVTRQRFPESAHFVGGLLEPVDPSRVELARSYRLGEDLDPRTLALNPAGQGWATVGLPGTGRRELPNSLVWAQIGRDARSADPDELRHVILDRAKLVGLDDLELLPGADAILPVTVQLSLLRDHAVQGRVLLAGDELVGPYFPTSTGGSHALGVNGPRLATTLQKLHVRGADVAKVLRAYDRGARTDAARVLALGRNELLEDLGTPRRATVRAHLVDLVR